MHPEEIPASLPGSEAFTFSHVMAKEAVSALDQELTQLRERVDKIVDLVVWENDQFGRIEVLKSLLRLGPNPEDMRLLAKCLDRIADIYPRMKEAESRASVAKFITEQPDWFTATFANLSAEVDEIDTFFHD